ncbi:hypothetical protein BV25DRAFT_1843569 [Artomyces pyxidatus]|uniref:Uncharacterized protein n=1 Tax=Artomyces pyxidatus TaxID=48021 RepID=A0ACB8SDM9_9AGAM|nr:hypothetical protein BV25DRAFT_1843569 [Artomyces pyxidatus]
MTPQMQRTTGQRKLCICTSVISKLIFGRNSWTNLFAMCRGISLFATKAHQSMYRVRSRLTQCVLYSTVHTTLVTMAVAERKVVQELFATPDADPPLVVFDNMQAMARRREQKLGTANKMIIGTGATAVKMENCEPGAFDLAPILEKYEQGGCRELRIQDVLDKIDIERMQKVFAYHWLDALVTYVPDLVVYRTEVSELFARNIWKHQINPKQHTTVYPLSTNSANEVSTRGLKDVLTDFLKQLGITKTTLGKRLIFFHGDGKSYEGMLKHVRSIIAWVHGKSDQQPEAYRFPQVDFYQNARLIDVTVRGHMLQCWEYVPVALVSLEDYFLTGAWAEYTWEQMISFKASTLSERYSTSMAYARALQPSAAGNRNAKANMKAIPQGPRYSRNLHNVKDRKAGVDPYATTVAPQNVAGDAMAKKKKKKQRPQKPFERDWPLANSILLMQDRIWFMEVCRAVALGDIGRVWEVLKMWMFTFSGAGNSNYATYLIEMFVNIEHDYPKVTRNALFNNWLVNRQGKPGHFHELDLMQEHFNHWLEELAQHKGKEFDDE